MQNCETKITDIYLQSRMNKPTMTEKLLYKKKAAHFGTLVTFWTLTLEFAFGKRCY